MLGKTIAPLFKGNMQFLVRFWGGGFGWCVLCVGSRVWFVCGVGNFFLVVLFFSIEVVVAEPLALHQRKNQAETAVLGLLCFQVSFSEVQEVANEKPFKSAPNRLCLVYCELLPQKPITRCAPRKASP